MESLGIYTIRRGGPARRKQRPAILGRILSVGGTRAVSYNFDA